MSLHAEILPPEQQAALRQLGRPATECGFYLGGGTAIAAHLGHRQSQDLDWFTGERIEDPLALARELQERGAELRVEGSGGRRCTATSGACEPVSWSTRTRRLRLPSRGPMSAAKSPRSTIWLP